jgi:hypothetical protein
MKYVIVTALMLTGFFVTAPKRVLWLMRNSRPVSTGNAAGC